MRSATFADRDVVTPTPCRPIDTTLNSHYKRPCACICTCDPMYTCKAVPWLHAHAHTYAFIIYGLCIMHVFMLCMCGELCGHTVI